MFFVGKIETLAESDKGSYKLVPIFLSRLFLLVFPTSHKQWILLYKRTLKFNKENVIIKCGRPRSK